MRFDYWGNKKLWMKISISFDWLVKFDSKLNRENPNVLSLMENFSVMVALIVFLSLRLQLLSTFLQI